MLSLGACAEENIASPTQEAPSQQVETVVQEVNSTNITIPAEVDSVTETAVTEETPLTNIANTLDKTPVVAESVKKEIKKDKLVVAMADEPISSQDISEIQEKTAAQAMLNLEQYRGKVVYLDFWASWCQPCQQTFPWMDAMQKKYPDDIVFIAVNFGENPEDTQEFLKRFPADIKFVYDPLVQIAREYGVPGLPYSFIYGRNGELLGKHAGFSGGSEINLEAALKNLFESGQ